MKSSQDNPTVSLPDSTPWTIGEIAARFGIATHVLRYWEDVGLLRPARDQAGRRHYGRDEISRITVILGGKEAGLGLEQLKAILDADPGTRRALLRAHHVELDRRMEAIRTSQRLTQHALDCQAGDFTTCPYFQELVAETIRDSRSHHAWPVSGPAAADLAPDGSPSA